MISRAKNKGKHCIHYGIKQWKTKGIFYIINDISEHLTLVQSLYTIGNSNHAVSISVNWIFDSKYENNIHWKNNNWILYILLCMANKALKFLNLCFMQTGM